MAHFYTQVTMEHDSALPEDRTVNTWAVVTADVDQLTELGLWHAALTNFYQAIDSMFSLAFSGAGTIKSYNRAHPEPRVPTLDSALALTVGATAFPSEVALCMSFQAARVSGQPQSRRRGRVFLGPFDGGRNDGPTGRPSSTTISTIVTAGDALLTASDSASGWDWEVWSQVNQTGAVVHNGWVDNAWDTQRRRGLRASSRSTFV